MVYFDGFTKKLQERHVFFSSERKSWDRRERAIRITAVKVYPYSSDRSFIYGEVSRTIFGAAATIFGAAAPIYTYIKEPHFLTYLVLLLLGLWPWKADFWICCCQASEDGLF